MGVRDEYECIDLGCGHFDGDRCTVGGMDCPTGTRKAKIAYIGRLDRYALILTADEFQLLRDVFAGAEDPAEHHGELDYIVDSALDLSDI